MVKRVLVAFLLGLMGIVGARGAIASDGVCVGLGGGAIVELKRMSLRAVKSVRHIVVLNIVGTPEAETYRLTLDGRRIKVMRATSDSASCVFIYANQVEQIHVYLSEGDDSYDGRAMATEQHVWAGSGDDEVMGGRGSDRLFGGAGNDELRGFAGRDKLVGGSGDDTLIGGDDKDVLEGKEGNDILAGGMGYDTLNGGSGRNQLYQGEIVTSSNEQGGKY
ncbi:calcium-binding protein [Pseudoalteromonas rubra]|uniref:calcium-binding protein n=1 Tax=Pseudoalteromonas rubra TaxID=43658 RepID=UPI000F76EAD9|nr:calcium-binding protein [Pseudoalteromonas rubra]